jgi:hypothetical protein
MMVFFSPTKLGEALRVRSPWFWTLVIVAVIVAVIMFFIPADVFLNTMEAQAAGRPQGQQAPDPETMLKVARFGGVGAALVMTFISAFIAAGVLYLAFNVAMGQELAYKQHLSAVAHVFWIPSVLGMIVTFPIWVSRGDMLTTLGLGLLLTDAPASFVGHFMNSITIFGLWGAAALGAIESGLSGGRLTVGKAVTVTFVLYLVWVVVNAARATVFGA